jgi:hypothetical protein
MRNKVFMLGVLALILASTALAYVPTQKINFQNCSDPQRLERMLNDQFGGLKDDISGLYFAGTGNFFYVDSNTGSSTYTGLDWVHPKATLDSAVALCTANNGDVIFVASGHSEALSGADGVDLDVAGITVVGLGNGSDRPKFVYSNAAGEFVIGAASVSIYNLQFVPSVTAITHAIDVEIAGDWALIAYCEFPDGEAAATDEFIDTIQVGTTATDVTILGCRYFSTGTDTNNFIDLSAATIANCTIRDCVIRGAFAEAGIWAGAAVPTNVMISNCDIANTTASQYCVEFQGAATGRIETCRLNPATYGYGLDPGSLACFGNTANAGIDSMSYQVPTTLVAPEQTNYLLVRAPATGSFDTTGVWSTAAAHEILTVTGMVKITIVAECIESIVSASDTGTVSLGDETNAASIIAASTAGSGVWVLGELWADATLTRTILTQTQLNALTFIVGAGKDIGYTIATNALTDGALNFHVWWTPITAGATVVAGAGGVF